MEIFGIKIGVTTEGADEAKKKIKDLNEELKKSGETGFGKVMEGIKDKLGEVSGVSLPSAISNFGALEAAMANPVGAAIALAAAMSGLGVAMALHYAEVIDHFADLGEKLGWTANQVMFVKNALDDAGTSIDAFQAAGEKLSKSMAKSGDESKGAGAAFERLGVSTEDSNGHLRATADVMDQLVEKYGEGKLSTGDMADMQLVLGKNFRESILAYKTAKDGVEEHNAAMQAGIGITNESIKITGDNEKAMRGVKETFTSIGAIMVERVIPAFTDLAKWFVKSYTEGGTVAKVIDFIANATSSLITWLSLAARALGTFVDTLMVVGGVGRDVFGGLVRILSGDLKGGADQIIHSFDGVGGKLEDIGKRQVQIGVDAFKALKDTVTGANTAISATADAMERVKKQNAGNAQTKVGDLFGGSAGGTAVVADKKEKADPIVAYIDALNKQALAQEHVNMVDQVTLELSKKKYDDSDKELKQEALVIAGKIDSAKASYLIKEAVYNSQKAVNEYVDSLEMERKAHTMGARDYKELLEDRKLDILLADQINKLRADGLWTQERENQLIAQNIKLKQQARDATVKAKDADQDWVGGINAALNTYKDTAENKFKQAQDAATNSFKTMEDGLVQFAMTGKFNFSDMAKSIIADLIRIQIRAQMSGLFKMVGGAILGAMGGSSEVGAVNGPDNIDVGGGWNPGRAIGGPVEAGSSYMVGENGPEILRMGNSSGNIIPNSQIGSGGGMSIGQIQINIQGGQTNDETAAVMKREMVDTMRTIADGRIANAKRPGGLLAQTR